MSEDLEFRLRHLENAHATHKATVDEQLRTLFINFGSLMQTMSEQTRELSRLNTNIETDRTLHREQNLKPMVDRHEKILNEQKGGWRMLCILVGAAGALGGFVGWLASLANWKSPTH